MKIIKSILPFIMVLLCISCIIDTKPLGYSVRNCTYDTLCIYLSEQIDLSNEMYLDKKTMNEIGVTQDDTTVVYINGDTIIVSNYFLTMPNSRSGADWTLCYEDSCYLYAIKWDVLMKYTLDEIKMNKLYDKRVITKRDFHNHIFDYTQDITGGQVQRY